MHACRIPGESAGSSHILNVDLGPDTVGVTERCSPDSRETPAPVRITMFSKGALLPLVCRTSLSNLPASGPPVRDRTLQFRRCRPVRVPTKEILKLVGCATGLVLTHVHLS